MSGLQELSSLLDHANPGFVCVPPGRVEDGRRFVARVRHLSGEPAPARTLIAFSKAVVERKWQFGIGLIAINDFFERHNGVLLYAPTIPRFDIPIDRDGGIRIFPLEDWIENGVVRVHQLFDTFTVIDPGVGRDDAIAIGEVPWSSNLFGLVIRGPRAGQVVRLDHDRTLDANVVLGRRFDEFLSTICREPAHLLDELGCYTRYADGTTAEPWVPVHYTADVGALRDDEIRHASIAPRPGGAEG